MRLEGTSSRSLGEATTTARARARETATLKRLAERTKSAPWRAPCMHDIGKSGWWLLIGLIPIIGWIVLIVWLATKSDAGANKWGETVRA